MNLKETYDQIAEDWHADHQNDNWWAGGTDAFTPLLQPGDLVLDVGCGGGMKSRHLIEKGLRVIGIDFSDKMIEIAKREVPKGEFRVLDLREAGTLGQKFDGIFMQAVLLHIPRSEASDIIKMMVGLLKNGGHLYIAVKGKKEGKSDEEMKLERDYGYSYERFFSYFDMNELREFLRQAGCEVVFEKVTPAGNTHWLEVIGRKK